MGCANKQQQQYNTFADFPGFDRVYPATCREQALTPKHQALLEAYRPRFILAPDSTPAVDFYRDYLPYARLRHFSDSSVRINHVDRALLQKVQYIPGYYLDFDYQRFKREYDSDQIPSVYGRVYTEAVSFPSGSETVNRRLTFLKYNLTFPVSGLPASMNWLSHLLLGLSFMDKVDWHELDHFVAVDVVLDEHDKPIAVILAQHNHHRSYLLGKHMQLPPDKRLRFEVARRSNELYPAAASTKTSRHRTIRWTLYMKYLLTGNDPPYFRADDITYSIQAGGVAMDYDLTFPSNCDPYYTAKIMLGEPRSFLGMYIGRDGPPGADYYTIPELVPQGRLLKSAYLHENDKDDIAIVEKALNVSTGHMNLPLLLEHGGRKFYRQWQMLASHPALAGPPSTMEKTDSK